MADGADRLPGAEELQGYAGQADVQTAEVEALAAKLDLAQLHWRPAPEAWSIAEHIAHLPITNARYLDGVDRTIADARARNLVGAGPYRHGWIGNWFVRGLEPPPRMRIRTFRSLVPPARPPREETLAAFRAAQDRLRASLFHADGLDLGRARMRSPFLPLLRLTLGQAFGAILAHNRRHIWHMRRVLESPGFPVAPAAEPPA